MENVNERQQHLKDLLTLIDDSTTFIDSNFQTLHHTIQDEIDRETKRLSDVKKNTYLHNLKQTLDKQVTDYKEAIPNFKHVEYFRFLKSFREDIKDELERLSKYA
jgi:hypothetical protein